MFNKKMNIYNEIKMLEKYKENSIKLINSDILSEEEKETEKDFVETLDYTIDIALAAIEMKNLTGGIDELEDGYEMDITKYMKDFDEYKTDFDKSLNKEAAEDEDIIYIIEDALEILEDRDIKEIDIKGQLYNKNTVSIYIKLEETKE